MVDFYIAKWHHHKLLEFDSMDFSNISNHFLFFKKF